MTDQHQIPQSSQVVDAGQMVSSAECEARLAKYLYKLADKAYGIEEARGHTLDDLSAQLLTCVTILSVAFLTPASLLFECYEVAGEGLSKGQIRLIWMYAAVLIPLVIALLLVLWSKVLKTMESLASPMTQANYVRELLEDKNKGPKMTDLDIAESYCAGIEDKYNGMHEKHDDMWMRLCRAMYLIAASCVAALIFGVVMLLEH